MKLYGYFRSTASYRVRIALHWKNLEFENLSVHLVNQGGEQHLPAFQKLNPNELVPVFIDGALVIRQSMAVLEYLEEKYPANALLPRDHEGRAHVREMSQLIACDIHPLNNLRILQYIKGPLKQDDESKMAWYFHWLKKGFDALEQMVADGGFCHGDTLSHADLCLIPQLYNAHRFNFPLEQYPKLLAIEKNCLALTAFQAALPENQPDAPQC